MDDRMTRTGLSDDASKEAERDVTTGNQRSPVLPASLGYHTMRRVREPGELEMPNVDLVSDIGTWRPV